MNYLKQQSYCQPPSHDSFNERNNDSSKYNQSNQSYFQSGIYCDIHPNEPVTNYCSSLACLKALCPDCVDIHYKQHIEWGTCAEIQSFKNVKQSCSKKLKSAIIGLDIEVEKVEQQYFVNPDQILDENLMQLRQCKEKVFDMIELFFNNQEEELTKKINGTLLRTSDFQPIFQKIRSLMDELEQLNYQLDESSSEQIIKRVCLLDVNSMMNKFKKDILKVVDSKDIEPIRVKIEDKQIKEIQLALDKLVRFQKYPNNKQSQEQLNNTVNQSQLDSFMFEKKASNPNPNTSILKDLNESSQQMHGRSILKDLNESTTQNIPPNPRSNKFNSCEKVNSSVQQSPIKQQQFNSNGKKQQNINIRMDNYYEQQTPKQLNFFLNEGPNKNKVFVANLAQKNPVFEELNLKLNFDIPHFHKSIIIPNGDVYITGGRQQDGQKLDGIYKLEAKTKTLTLMCNMNVPRSSHGICYADGFIYLVGGFTNNQKMTKTVERYNPEDNTCTLLASLNHTASSLCITSFNNKFIFKFGGIGESRQLSPYIERYDIEQNQWKIVDPKISQFENPTNFGLLSTSCCIQINKSDIFVFGGYTESNIAQKLTYIFSVDEDNYTIRFINSKPLLMAEGFWNNNAVIINNSIFALQNVPCSNTNNCLENQRKIIKFDGKEWTNLN